MTLNNYLFSYNEWRIAVHQAKENPEDGHLQKVAAYWQMQFILRQVLYFAEVKG